MLGLLCQRCLPEANPQGDLGFSADQKLVCDMSVSATADSHCCCRTQHAWHADAYFSVNSIPVALGDGVALGLGEYEGDLGLSAHHKLVDT